MPRTRPPRRSRSSSRGTRSWARRGSGTTCGECDGDVFVPHIRSHVLSRRRGVYPLTGAVTDLRAGLTPLIAPAVPSDLAQFSHAEFWGAVVQIIWADLVLSGDNAVVIALACRGLPARQRRWGMIIGAGAAAFLLIGFTVTVSALMTLPYLRLIGACALLVIAIRLLGPSQSDASEGPEATANLWRAVRTVVVADVVMGLDNAVAVAAIANGRYVLLALGLAISVPIVVAGSTIMLKVIERFPVIVWVGGAVLGYVAGEVFASDPVVEGALEAFAPTGLADSAVAQAVQRFADQFGLAAGDLLFRVFGALMVILAGAVWRHLSESTSEAK